MMRGPGNWAVAVRTPSGEIAQVSRSIESQMARHWVFRLPIVRGVMALGESLAIGFRALAISANYAAQEENGRDGGRHSEVVDRALARRADLRVRRRDRLRRAALQGDARAAHRAAADQGHRLVRDRRRAHPRHASSSRTSALISLLPDLRRVFQYHAAEHKAINAYEAGEELEPEIVQRFSLIHPRCGTAFMLWVMVIAVFVFAFFGRPHWYWLIAERILLLPLIAGPRLRADPLRRQAPGQPRADDGARARHVAAAADDARADARPARGLDPRAARGAELEETRQPTRRASKSWPSCATFRVNEWEPDGNGSSRRRDLEGQPAGGQRHDLQDDERRDRRAAVSAGPRAPRTRPAARRAPRS